MAYEAGTGVILPSAIHGRQAVDSLADDDELLVYRAESGGLVKIFAQNLPSGSGGGGGDGASTDAKFVLSEADVGLPNSTVITAGDGITITNSKGKLTVAANIGGGNGVSISTSKGQTVAGLDVPGLTAASTLNLTDVIPLHDGTGHKKTTVQDLVDLAQAGTATPTVVIETITQGEAGTAGSDAVNEQQIVEFQGTRSAISGTVAFTFGGQSTSGLSVSSLTASYLETALATLSSISGSDKIDCTDGGGSNPRDITVEFVGSMAGASQSLITVAPTLTSSALKIDIVETTPGEAGASLVEVWKLDEAGATDDRTGEMGVADFTSANAAVGLGRDGACLTSGGSNNYLATAPTAGLGFGTTAARSISAWIRVDNVGNETLLEWSCSTTSLKIQKYDDAGPLKFRAVAETSTGQTIVTSSSASDTGQWHFVVASWDGTNVGLSVDGAAFETSARGGNMATGNATVTASAFNSDRIDEPALWSVAMSDETAAALWNFGTGDFYPYADTGTSEVQTITLTGSPSWGSFTLSYGGETTTDLGYNVNAATVQAALRALTGLSAVTCSGDLGGGMTVTFPSSMGNVALLTCDYSRLLCRVRRIQSGAGAVLSVPGTNEVQEITISGAGGGTFSLDFDGTTIGPIDYDCDSSALQAAFDEAGVSVAVSGSGPFEVEFVDALAETDVPEMTPDDSELTPASQLDSWRVDSSRAGTLTGNVDGTNATFTLRTVPSSRCIPLVIVCHLVAEEGYEYTRDGATFTFTAGNVPTSGVPIQVRYFV